MNLSVVLFLIGILGFVLNRKNMLNLSKALIKKVIFSLIINPRRLILGYIFSLTFSLLIYFYYPYSIFNTWAWTEVVSWVTFCYFIVRLFTLFLGFSLRQNKDFIGRILFITIWVCFSLLVSFFRQDLPLYRYYAPIFLIRGDIPREVSNDPTFFIERYNQSTPSPSLNTTEVNKGKVKLPRLNTDVSRRASSIEEVLVEGKSSIRKIRPYFRDRTKQGQSTSTWLLNIHFDPFTSIIGGAVHRSGKIISDVTQHDELREGLIEIGQRTRPHQVRQLHRRDVSPTEGIANQLLSKHPFEGNRVSLRDHIKERKAFNPRDAKPKSRIWWLLFSPDLILEFERKGNFFYVIINNSFPNTSEEIINFVGRYINLGIGVIEHPLSNTIFGAYLACIVHINLLIIFIFLWLPRIIGEKGIDYRLSKRKTPLFKNILQLMKKSYQRTWIIFILLFLLILFFTYLEFLSLHRLTGNLNNWIVDYVKKYKLIYLLEIKRFLSVPSLFGSLKTEWMKKVWWSFLFQ